VSGSSATRTGAIALWCIAAIVLTTVFRRRLRLSYEVWQGLHLGLSVAAAAAMLIHVLQAGRYVQAAPVRNVALGYAAGFGLVTLNYRLIRPLRLLRRPWEVVANLDAGASTRLVRVRPTGHTRFPFDPGQFAWLVTGRTPLWSQQHPLSICSSAEPVPDGTIEFAIKALGDWSSQVVPRLSPGSRVWVEGPFGAFTTEGRAAQGFVLVAGGVGIAPMRSVLLTMRDRGDRRHVVLLYAAHDETRMAFRHELLELRGTLALDVVFVFEEPGDPSSGEHGILTRAMLQRHLPQQFRRYHFLVCGPPPMMDAVEASLQSLGVPAAAIDSERFNLV
jgi:predicted ferric reductase